MAPLATLIRQSLDIKLYEESGKQYLTVADIAKILKSNLTTLTPLVDSVPSALKVVLNLPELGDTVCVSNESLPSLLVTIAKPPTPRLLINSATGFLRVLIRKNFSLVSFIEEYSGALSPVSAPFPQEVPPLFETIEDRVAALIQVAGNLTKNYDDINGTLTLAGGGAGLSGIKVLANVFQGLAFEPVSTGVTYCLRYWPGVEDTGTGGLFVWDSVSTSLVDNGLVFKGAVETGRWLRVKNGSDPSITDFGAIGTSTLYSRDLSLNASGAPKTLLSSKFNSVAEANAWYPGSSVISLTESVNSAAIQHCHASQKVTKIPIGTFWINRSIEVYTERVFRGQGVKKTTLLVDGLAGAAFIPLARQDAVYSTGNEIYKERLDFGSFSCWSDVHTVEYATGNVTKSVAYDVTKSGFYFPPRKRTGAGGLVGDLSPDEANLGFPLVINSDISKLVFGRFAGDGFRLGNQFSSKVSFISGDENAGYCISFFANSASALEDCYPLRLNQLGGFNLPYGGSLTRCNGIDTFSKQIRWGTVGVQGSPDQVTCVFKNCNFEGTGQALYIYGDATYVRFSDCNFQWHIPLNGSPLTSMVRCYGSVGTVRFEGKTYVSPSLGASPVDPKYLLTVNGNGWTVCSDSAVKLGSTFLKWMVTDSLGADDPNAYGSLIIPYSEGYSFPGNGIGAAGYGEYLNVAPLTQSEKLYIGRSQGGTQKMVSLSSGSGAPGNTGAQKGSIYFRQDGSSINETIYVCTEYLNGVNTWVSK